MTAAVSRNATRAPLTGVAEVAANILPVLLEHAENGKFFDAGQDADDDHRVEQCGTISDEEVHSEERGQRLMMISQANRSRWP